MVFLRFSPHFEIFTLANVFPSMNSYRATVSIWSYLPLFQNDATLVRGVNSQTSKEEIIKFDLRLVISFRTMGLFFFGDFDFMF